MTQNKKLDWTNKIYLIGFIISLVIVIISIHSLNKENCPNELSTTFGFLITLSCTYGFRGIAFIAILFILFLLLIKIINKSVKTRKN